MTQSEYEHPDPETDLSKIIRTLDNYSTMTKDYVRKKDRIEGSIQLLRDYIIGLDDDMKNFSAEEFMILFNMKTGNDPKKMIYELWRTFKRKKMGQLNYWTMDWSPENCVLNRLFPYDKFVGNRRRI